MRRAAIAVAMLACVCGTAGAQQGTRPASALEDFPHVAIGNGLITAQAYPPGKKQLYQGTRFDHAGVVFHVTYKGQDYSNYWFDRFVIDPSNEGNYPPGVQHSCCSVSGPVEEFAAVGFEEAGPCPKRHKKQSAAVSSSPVSASSSAPATSTISSPPCPY
jgi:hypothetical protein